MGTLSRQLQQTVKYVRRINQEKQEWMRREVHLQNEIRELRQQRMGLLGCQQINAVQSTVPDHIYVDATQPGFHQPSALVPLPVGPHSDSFNSATPRRFPPHQSLPSGPTLASTTTTPSHEPAGPGGIIKNTLKLKRQPAYKLARKTPARKTAQEVAAAVNIIHSIQFACMLTPRRASS
jgi:hypothetical protein